MTARLLLNEHWCETWVWVSSDFVNEVEITGPTIQGVVAQTGDNVVLGRPVNLNMQNTVVMVMNFPEVVLGRALVGHDQQLRAAGLA